MRADVVLPVAPSVEKAGTYMDWEGRLRTFEAVLPTAAMTGRTGAIGQTSGDRSARWATCSMAATPYSTH